MASVDIGESLLMYSHSSVSEHRAEFKEVVLNGAKVGGQISLVGAEVGGKLIMEFVEIGQSLHMRSLPEHRTEFEEVDLNGAKIGGVVDLRCAKVDGKLSMEAADIGIGLRMDSDRCVSEHRAEFKELVLNGAKVGGQLNLSGAKVAGKLDMYAVDIGLELFMKSNSGMSEPDTDFDGGIRLISAVIGNSLDLRGAFLSSLDLTRTKIGGDLRLASAGRPPQWRDGGRLVLRNATVDSLRSTANEADWPPHFELNGFTYRRFGGLGAGRELTLAKRGSRWFIDWLAKDEPYTPGSYKQCAQVLREMGDPEMANDVLYAGQERERKEARRSINNPRWVWLTLLKSLIGYGYGHRYFRSLWWAGAFLLLGILVLYCTGQIDKVGGSLLAAAYYSFDLLLPIVELYKHHYDIVLDGFAKYYFGFHQLMGYVLASFLIAGLSGLTK